MTLVKSFIEERYRSRVSCHVGPRNALLKVPGIEAKMFPKKGGKRRWADGVSDSDPGWFSTTLRKDGLWRVALFKEVIQRPSIEDGVEIAVMRDKMLNARRESVREAPQPGKRSYLSKQAIEVAEGWTLLPPPMKAAICGIINEHLPRLADSPTLRELYDNANRHDQARYERNCESAIHRNRGDGASA